MKSVNISSLSCGQLRFDAYCATTTEASEIDLLNCFPEGEALSTNFENVYVHGYRSALYVEDARGKRVATILSGKSTGEVFIEVKGPLTPVVAENLRSRFAHKVSRADVCVDTCKPGAFKQLLKYCLAAKKASPRTRGERHGDWDDHPEDGRTYYLGSRSSLCQVCLYEKGKTSPYRGMGLEDWVRLEWRLRPETQEQKRLAASLEPHELLMLSAMGRRVAEMVLADFAGSLIPTTPREKSSPERAFDYMMGQYSKTMWKMSHQLGGVDLLLGEIGLRLTGRPWQAFDCGRLDDEKSDLSNKGGPHRADFDPVSWSESMMDDQPELEEEPI